ncbi:fimbrial isopeptide formation D2 family protein/LPXTG-motif cell wall-anchored protein, partial [Streptococcus rupicaprae]
EIAVTGANVLGEAAQFFDVAVDGQTVTATMKDFKDAKALAGKEVELVITAHIKPGVTTAKIPNTAKVTYQNKSHVDGTPDSETPPTPPVTVTPPPLTKKINESLDHLDVANATDYTYNIKTLVPGNIAKFKSYAIVDTLDEDLEAKSAKIVGEAAKYFDVKVDGQKVTATMKDFKAAAAIAGQEVELVIVSQIREGVTRQAIPNTAKITFSNTPIVDGEEDPKGETPPKETPPTPPVTVTPPGENPTVSKKINDTLDHLDVATETDYNYNIKSLLPVDIASYKSYVITDTLDNDLAVQGTPTIVGDAAAFFDVKVDGQTVTATITDFAAAASFAGKEVELVIQSQIREGVTREKIPNTAKVTYRNKSHVDGTPDSETPPTPPVTVTPPTPNTPPITKKVNGAEKAELGVRNEIFTYTIDTAVPTGAFAFQVMDTLEPVLAFEGDVKATVAGQALAADQITIDGQTVTVTLTKEQVKAHTGKEVRVAFQARIKDGVDLTPYMVDGVTSVPNTANYIINNDPTTKKDSNTVPVVPPTPDEPTIDKKINKTLEHLDIEVNTSYLYHVTANLPQDIASYQSFVVTDQLEDVLAINGDVIAYVDGSETDAVKVTVEGNLVTATVTDFAKLAGRKQIQLYIPAYIKAEADLTAYLVEGVAKVPNTATVAFKDSNGKDGNKPTKPVTVTPPTPVEPPKPEDPTPDSPVKTVSRVEGLEQAALLRLLDAQEAFRFDIKSAVPSDEAEDKRINLTSLTVTDTLDALFAVKKEGIAVKLTGTPAETANYVDEDVLKAQTALDEAKAKLAELQGEETPAPTSTELETAKQLVADLTQELATAQASLDALKATPAEDGATAETPNEAVTAQEQVVADLQSKLTAAQAAVTALETAQPEAPAVNPVNPAERQVAISNQEKVVEKAEKALAEAKDKQAKLAEKLALFGQVNEKGELTAEAIEALGGKITVEGQDVTVDFSDEMTMEALKGYTVNVIIYTAIKDVKALTDAHYKGGIDNIATVQYNHNPDAKFTKKTNKVTVIPPRKTTPPPVVPPTPVPPTPVPPTPPTTPDKPKVVTPKTPKSDLPKTGEQVSILGAVGLVIGLVALGFYGFSKRKK